jgi:hypothetical protein
LGPHPKPEAGELLQIILRVPPFCSTPVAGGAAVVVVGAAVGLGGAGAVVVAAAGGAVVGLGGAGTAVVVDTGGATVGWVVGAVVVVAGDEVQAARNAITTTSKRQTSRVNFDLCIYSSFYNAPIW